MIARLVTWLVVAALLATPHAFAADVELTPVIGDILWAPVPVSGSDGRRHLVYELRLANPTPLTIDLDKVEVLDGGSGQALATATADDIGKRFAIGGRRGAEAKALTVGQFGVLFLHVALDAGAPSPRSLTHRVSGRLVQPDKPFAVAIGPSPVSEPTGLVIGPPLLGTGYVAADGCCDSIRHVRALLPLNGRFALAQRFAIDWEQVDAENRLVNGGDLKKVASYNIFGKEVIAVADGTVVASRNDLPEQVPGKLPDGLPIDQADGNFVVLDIGNGAFALFAHMQPGSVTVKAGQKVARGQVLGKVGNTGNSQAPHLHFHVMDGPSPLLANGIPYLIDQYSLTAIDKAGTADFDKAEATGSPLTLTPLSSPQTLKGVLPLDLTVVEFAK